LRRGDPDAARRIFQRFAHRLITLARRETLQERQA
jgi:hypothetical protein